MPILQDGDLVLYGFVGENFWDEGFTASEVLTALATHGRDKDLTVRINSGGGYIDDGIAIYNALVAHRGKVRVEVDAMAASSASIIAMAGEEIVMKAGSLMMIHDPANITFGTIADHEKTIEMLEAQATQMASIYAERSDQDVEKVREDMKAETWLTADQAVERGYADTAEKARARAVAAFDFGIYTNAPQRLKALAKRKNWSLETTERTAATASAQQQPRRQHEERSMTDTTAAGGNTTADIDRARAEAATAAVAAYRERRRTVMALPEAAGREGLAEHLVDTTEMPVEAIKATLAAAPKAATSTAAAETPAQPAATTTAPAATAAADPATVAEYERQRLNGAGLGGGGSQAAAPKKSLADNMRKLLGKKEAA